MNPLHTVVEMHSSADWGSLAVFYGTIAAGGAFLALEVVRARRIGRLIRDLKAGVHERLDRQSASTSERISGIEARGQELRQEAQTVRQRVDRVEDSIPSLYERLDEFRNTLATIFRDEMEAVLGSFDGTVTAVLGHMKSELHMGIARIESIEEMVRSRQRAEQMLLGDGTAPALPEGQGNAPEGGKAGEEEVVAEEQSAPQPDLAGTDEAEPRDLAA
jgi:hypothetical protein